MSCSCPWAPLPVPASSKGRSERLDRRSSKDKCAEGKHASRHWADVTNKAQARKTDPHVHRLGPLCAAVREQQRRGNLKCAGTHPHSSGDGRVLGQSIIGAPTAFMRLYIAEGQERGKLYPHLGEEHGPCQDLLSGLVHSQGQSHHNLNSPQTTSLGMDAKKHACLLCLAIINSS